MFPARDPYAGPDLMPGEQLIAVTRISAASLIGTLLFFALGFTALILAFAMGVDRLVLLFIGGVWALLLVVVVLAFMLIRRKTGFTLTNTRLLIKAGVVTTEVQAMQLAQVEAIRVDQGLLGKVLGYGTVVLTGTGGSEQTCKDIEEPFTFSNQLQAQVALVQKGE